MGEDARGDVGVLGGHGLGGMMADATVTAPNEKHTNLRHACHLHGILVQRSGCIG